MKSLFPEIDNDVRQDRLAARRETKQRAREYIEKHAGYETFLLKHLTDHGPTADASLCLEMAGIASDIQPAIAVMAVAHAMWRTGKLWRNEFPNHPSGEKCYVYGIRGTHPKPAE